MKLLWCVMIGCMAIAVKAQNTELQSLVKTDSLNTIKEKRTYQLIEDYSQKRKFTRFIHRLFFRKTNNFSSTSKDIKKEKNIDYATYQNKIIRHINITILDPFGFSEKDTTIFPQKKIDKIGNFFHIKTQKFTIKKQLLFKEKQPMDSLTLKESERLLRSRRYIRRVLIQPTEIKSSTDSVDIQVTVLDGWSLTADGLVSETNGKIRIRERNFLGLGHQVSVSFQQKINNSDNGYAIEYLAENIRQTYINANILYSFNYLNTFEKKWSLERNFFSPRTQWAGHIEHYQSRFIETLNLNGNSFFPYIQKNTTDISGAYAFLLKTEQQEIEKTTNLILSARFQNLKYNEKPTGFLDPNEYYTNQNLYIAKIELNERGYIEDRYIFRHGDIEDVRIGKSFDLTAGMLLKNKKQFPYLGVGFSQANYTDKGYFGITAKIGSLFTNQNTQQTVIQSESVYFSNLFKINNWHLRQFLKSNVVIGFNRLDYIKDQITINNTEGIMGFYSSSVYGTRKLVLSSQTQTYSPLEWGGFRFSPFLIIDIGFIGNEKQPFFKNNTYGKIGIGLYITNDYLTLQNVHISFNYFPAIPGQGTHVFRALGYSSNDSLFKNFEYQPPDIIQFK